MQWVGRKDGRKVAARAGSSVAVTVGAMAVDSVYWKAAQWDAGLADARAEMSAAAKAALRVANLDVMMADSMAARTAGLSGLGSRLQIQQVPSAASDRECMLSIRERRRWCFPDSLCICLLRAMQKFYQHRIANRDGWWLCLNSSRL